jgi:serpin B
LVPPGALDAFTRLVLVNAIYFKSTWASKFDPERTKDGPFFVSPKETVTVPMMTQTTGAGRCDVLTFLRSSLLSFSVPSVAKTTV